MNLSAPFVRRPIGTTLLTIGVALAGIVSYFMLPVSPLPSIDLPTIAVQAQLPGASPETMASSVAGPLERRLGKIADVTEMTSSSGTGSTRIILQFSLSRNIDGAARDVMAAINASRVDLPATLRQNPTYREVNSNEAPILILALTSRSRTPGQIYDAASTIIQQQLSQIKGVGEVDVSGSSLPAVRVELNPLALSQYQIGMEDVRAALASANANRPKGVIDDGPQRLQIYTNDQTVQPAEYADLIIAYRSGRPVRLKDVAQVEQGVEDVHNLGLFACGPPAGSRYSGPGRGAAGAGMDFDPFSDTGAPARKPPPKPAGFHPFGLFGGHAGAYGESRGLDTSAACLNTQTGARPSVIVVVRRQPGANIIDTVDRIKKALPTVEAALPQDINVAVAVDRTITIRASLADVERTLLIAVCLVVLVVAFFLKSARATIVPAVAVTVSLLGTLGVMYLAGFSLDNLSLMALTVSTGFVVDDAIVVLENVTRHLEAGMPRYQAALRGAKEVGFTVLSISISLIAVFIPILLMGGIVGRLFREFAITLSAAIMVSLVISLTTTPMICAYMLRPHGDAGRIAPRWWAKASDGFFGALLGMYERALDWALEEGPVTLAILICTIALNVFLIAVVPKGFFPQQDTGMLNGGMQADQASSFQISQQRLRRFVNMIRRDPAIDRVVGFVNGGRGGGGGGFVFMSLKPRGERKGGSEAVMARLRPQFNQVTGASMFLFPVQDIRIGGRQSNATYQYTLEGPDLPTLRTWATKLSDAMMAEPALTDVNTDQEDHGLETFVNVNRDTVAQLGLSASEIDNTLYDAFGQRQVATIYKAQNQYHVIMEAAPPYIQDPTALSNIYVSSTAAARLLASSLSAGGFSVPGYSPLAGTGASATAGSGGLSGLAAASMSPQLAPATGSGSSGVSGAPGQPSTGSALGGATGAPVTPTMPSPTTFTGSSPSGIAASTANTSSSALSFNAPGLGGGLSPGGGGGGPAAPSRSGYATSIGATAPPGLAASAGVAISTGPEKMVPLASVANWYTGSQPRSVNHQDEAIATTISFNIAPGKSLSDAAAAVHDAEDSIGMPSSVHGSFQGTAKVFQQSLSNEPVLVAAALLAVYIVLGVLYESYIHPLTVISTLPSAGVGAFTALILFKTEFSIIALIGVILLIGIVKKNAIMIIDFALDAERSQGCTTREAVRQASLLRFRPIMMTTFAAILGAMPLALGWGEGSEIRRPLGIAIIGGLLVSQVLTLITTPVVYLYLDRFRKRSPEERRFARGVAVGDPSASPEPA